MLCQLYYFFATPTIKSFNYPYLYQIYLYYFISYFKLIKSYGVFFRSFFKYKTNIFFCSRDIIAAIADFSSRYFYFMQISNSS